MSDQADPGAAVEPGERARAVQAVEILLRVLRKAMDCFADDDIETILVFLTVAAASAGRHLRDPDLLEALSGDPLPDHLHQPISGRAVAASTGLPRETVRRRLDTLVAQGRLARDGRGVRTLSDTLTQRRNREFAHTLVQELRNASMRLSRFDQA